jgi:hypothetical protein
LAGFRCFGIDRPGLQQGGKSEEYVKVCSLYGVGYYYMPGTDICLKLGGYVRYQATFNPGSSITLGPMNGSGGRMTRIDSADFGQRVRALITVDTRQQTAYGTLRTYTLLGYSQDTVGGSGAETTSPPVYMTRGFIQIAGFTLGKATSFFDIYPNASFGYNVGAMYVPDTGDAGKILATYTAQFGNGFSASIGIEQSRARPVVFLTPASGAFVLGAAPATNALGSGPNAGARGLPDLVGNLRVDQAWGSILVAAALHDASGGYFGTTTAGGDPGSNLGFALTAGAIFNLPMIAPGDRFAFQFVYSEGAIGYAAVTPSGGAMLHYDGDSGVISTNRVGYGFYTDGVFGCATGAAGACVAGAAQAAEVQNTTAWSLAAAFEHLWSPALKTSIYGSYIEVSHNDTAKTLICANGGAFGVGGVANGCNPDWSAYVIGSRTEWEPVRGWIMGVDILYTHLSTANPSIGTVLPASGAQVATALTGNQSDWVFTFRTQRNYHP